MRLAIWHAKITQCSTRDGSYDQKLWIAERKKAEKSTAKDLAEALYGIVAKHAEPEDVLYAMMNLHRKDASNAFKAALQAFGVTWERKTKGAEKVPA